MFKSNNFNIKLINHNILGRLHLWLGSGSVKGASQGSYSLKLLYYGSAGIINKFFAR